MLSSAIFIKPNLKCRFLHFTITYSQVKSSPYSQSFSSKQNTSASVPKSSHFLFNSSSPATVQKPVNFIRHICGLGASVGCERVERTFNTQRLKAQICLMKFTGFVCSLSNELNSKTSFYSTMQMFVFWCFVWHKLDSCDKVSNQCRARLNLRQYLFVQEQLRKGTGW